MDGICLAAGTVAGEGSFQGGERTRAEAGIDEDLAEVDELQKMTDFFQETTGSGV